MISRYPIISVSQQHVEDMHNVEEYDEFPIDFRIISQHQFNDKSLNQFVDQKHQNYETKFINNIPLIFHNGKIALPSTLVRPIITWYHVNLTHPGINRTLIQSICISRQRVSNVW